MSNLDIVSLRSDVTLSKPGFVGAFNDIFLLSNDIDLFPELDGLEGEDCV
jgi:hypothetical protein